MAPSLQINFGGLICPNPWWAASGPPGDSFPKIKRLFEWGAGAVVTKTCSLDAALIHNPANRIALQYLDDTVIAMLNTELISDLSFDEWLDIIKRTKDECPGCVLIVSIMEEPREEAWAEIARRVVDAGADGLEENFSCGHGMTERGMGTAVGDVPEYTFNTCSWVMREVGNRVPVIAKMTPNGQIGPVSQAALDAGCHLSGINTCRALGSVDPKTRHPQPANSECSTRGGLGGPAVHWIANERVATMGSLVRKYPRRSVSAIGGVYDFPTALDFFCYGGRSVQMCKALMGKGADRVIPELTEAALAYMEANGFESIDDFLGCSLDSVLGHSEHVARHEESKKK